MRNNKLSPAGQRWAKFWDCLRRALGAMCV